MKSRKNQHAIRLDNLLHGIKLVGEDLDFLCSLVEDPTEEYKIPDAVEYSHSVVSLMNQLTYMTCEIDLSKLTEDGEFVMLTTEQVETLSALSDKAEESLENLRECGISIQKN